MRRLPWLPFILGAVLLAVLAAVRVGRGTRFVKIASQAFWTGAMQAPVVEHGYPRERERGLSSKAQKKQGASKTKKEKTASAARAADPPDCQTILVPKGRISVRVLVCAVSWQTRPVWFEVKTRSGGFGNKFDATGKSLAMGLEEKPRLMDMARLTTLELASVFALPHYIMFRTSKEDVQALIASIFTQAFPGNLTRTEGKKGWTWNYRVVQEAILRYMPLRAEIASCVESTPPDKTRLTIHARGYFKDKGSLDDPSHNWCWMQPPCTFYEKLAVEGGFKSVEVVQGGETEHPCSLARVGGKEVTPWFEKFAQRHQDIEVDVHHINIKKASVGHRGTLDEFHRDVCIMLSATHLVTAYSSFSRSLAILNPRLQHLYMLPRQDNGGFLGKACTGALNTITGGHIHVYSSDKRNYMRRGHMKQSDLLHYLWDYPVHKYKLEKEC